VFLRHYLLLLLASFTWLASGCALINTTQKPEASSLPAPPLPASSVVLEVAFARIPLADEVAYSGIWSEVDEQHFPTELRRQMSANGLRCGLVGMQLPPKLKEALDASEPGAVERGEDSLADPELDRAPRRIQCRSGQRAKVLVTKQLDMFSLLLQEDGYTRGHLLTQAQCLFGLKAYPQGDGRAKIELTPEVEHGEMKTQFVGRDGSVIPQAGKDRVVLDKLRLSAMLAPGHVLMISGTPDVKGGDAVRRPLCTRPDCEAAGDTGGITRPARHPACDTSGRKSSANRLGQSVRIHGHFGDFAAPEDEDIVEWPVAPRPLRRLKSSGAQDIAERLSAEHEGVITDAKPVPFATERVMSRPPQLGNLDYDHSTHRDHAIDLYQRSHRIDQMLEHGIERHHAVLVIRFQYDVLQSGLNDAKASAAHLTRAEFRRLQTVALKIRASIFEKLPRTTADVQQAASSNKFASLLDQSRLRRAEHEILQSFPHLLERHVATNLLALGSPPIAIGRQLNNRGDWIEERELAIALPETNRDRGRVSGMFRLPLMQQTERRAAAEVASPPTFSRILQLGTTHKVLPRIACC
jgi:hypothetical protein